MMVKINPKKSSKVILQTPKGTHDIMPEDQKYWRRVEESIEKYANLNSYQRIDTPVIEYESLFRRSVGDDTDLVQKELFVIQNDDGDNYALKAEGTAPVARAYLEHGMQGWPQPVQLYYLSPIFRRERPQAGRYRQHNQVGFELIGSDDPLNDARVIAIAWHLLADLGLSNLNIAINSIGCRKCKPHLRKHILEYFQDNTKKLCPDCQTRLMANPFRILDCKNPACHKLAVNMPPMIDKLCAQCRADFTKVLEALDEAKIPYDLDHLLVRGLDYYTKTTFEIARSNDASRQNSLGGGGRYDNLIEELGGRPTPSIGFGIGIERVIALMKQQNIRIVEKELPAVFIVQLGEMAKKMIPKIIKSLEAVGIQVKAELTKNSIKSQLRVADKLQVPLTLIIGQREAIDKTVIVRDMKEGIQEVCQIENLVDKVKEKLGL